MDQKKIFLEETSKKKDEWQSGAEIAEELARLAAEISEGVLIIKGEKLPLGDSFSFAMKKQLKKGVISCDFHLQTKVAGKEAESPTVPATDNKKTQKFPSSGGKKLKKEISRLWKEVVKQVGAETVLPAELAAELQKKCEDYSLSANRQWFDAWRACADVVKTCVNAAQKGDFVTAREKISEVNHLTKECHKLYK